MTVVVYAKASSSSGSAPVYVPGVSVGIFAADSADPLNANVALLGGDVTYRSGETGITVGVVRSNWQYKRPQTNCQVTIQTDTTSVHFDSFVFDSAIAKEAICLDAAAGVNAGYWFVAFYDIPSQILWLSRTNNANNSHTNAIGGVAASVGTASTVCQGTRTQIALGAQGYYQCTAITTGICGTNGGPVSGTIGVVEVDGGVTWTCIATPGTRTRMYPAVNVLGTSSAVNQIVTGKGGIGLAAQLTYPNTIVAFTDMAIDASDNTKVTTSVIPANVGINARVDVTGGTGFTVQTATINAISPAGVVTMDRAMGTVNSTGGIGTGYYSQIGGEWSGQNVTVPASATAHVIIAAQIAYAGDAAYYRTNGIQIKWERILYTGTAQAPQGSSVPSTFAQAPSPWPPSLATHGISMFGYLPNGYTDFVGQTNPALTTMHIDASDSTKFTISSPDTTFVYAGGLYTITSGTGFNTGQQFCVRYATSNITVAGTYQAYDVATGLTPVSIGTVNSTGGHATFAAPAYPFAQDGGMSPFGFSPTDMMDAAYHAHIWEFQPHTSATQLDGFYKFWVDGVLRVWVAQAAVGVTPAGGAKQWCGQSLVFNHSIGAGIAANTSSLGGVMTLPRNAHDLFWAINLGDGTYTNTDGFRIWQAVP